MLYLIDANVLISAASSFYKFNRVPEYWEWLKHHGEQGNLKIPPEIYKEVTDGKDELATWMRTRHCRDSLMLKEVSDQSTVQKVLDQGYGLNLNEVDLLQIGKDPFLVAHAIGHSNRCVVTTEFSAPSRKRQNRKVPDVCMTMGVQWMSAPKFWDALDFRTNWKS